jgi:hypothetical protein
MWHDEKCRMGGSICPGALRVGEARRAQDGPGRGTEALVIRDALCNPAGVTVGRFAVCRICRVADLTRLSGPAARGRPAQRLRGIPV